MLSWWDHFETPVSRECSSLDFKKIDDDLVKIIINDDWQQKF